MKDKKMLIIGICLIVVSIILIILSIINIKERNLTDAEKFSREYKEVDKVNVFVYKSIEEIIEILKKGNGAVYLGFPECKWCQKYVTFINEVAKSTGVSEVYYYNIQEDRKNNTDEYQEIVRILEKWLLKDDNNNPRVYVPDLTVVKNGVILSHNNETSVINTETYPTPEDYWNEENTTKIKSILKTMFEEISTTCVDCNS